MTGYKEAGVRVLLVNTVCGFIHPTRYFANPFESFAVCLLTKRLAKCMELLPQQCIVIEDSDVGIEAARNAGMYALRFFDRDKTKLMKDTQTFYLEISIYTT